MKTLALLYAARVPTLLWGPPGIGKTAMVEAMTEAMGARVFTPHVRAPEDVAIPVARDGHVHVTPVAEFADAISAAESGESVVIFVDEITTLPPAVQAAILRFLDSGKIGSYRLPATAWRVAAANPPDCAAGGWDLEPPVANRLAHVTWEVRPREWANSFASWSWPSPRYAGLVDFCSPQWEQSFRQARGIIAGFIGTHPSLLHAMPPDPVQRGRAWPSPRTWEYAARALAAAGCDIPQAADAVAACVGASAAQQFVAWAIDANLPTPEELLKQPSLLKELRSDKQYAALIQVAAILRPSEWDAGWQLAAVAAECCRDAAAGTIVRTLSRMFRDGQAPAPIPPSAMRPYAALLEEASQ